MVFRVYYCRKEDALDRTKRAAFTGMIFMVIGTGLTLVFSRTTTITQCFLTFQIIGLGMGFITLSTLLIVQNSVKSKDLGWQPLFINLPGPWAEQSVLGFAAAL